MISIIRGRYSTISVQVLLDLSATFDTIDYIILLNRLRSTFGISDTAFTLLSSYLSNQLMLIMNFLISFHYYVVYLKALC